MVIVRKRDELAVHVVTANFIFADWNNKTNGVWSGHFPVRHSSEATVQASSSTAPTATKPTRETHGANEEHIGADLYRYYQALQALGSSPPSSFRLSSGRAPTAADAAGWSRLRFDWILHYDFRSAHTARIVASVPGRSAGRHKANDLEKWGHMRVRALLAKHPLPPKFDDAPLVMQFSSLSSVGTDDKWLRELVASFCGDGRCPLRIVFPTEDQVRDSLEGWPAGASIPCTDENACKLSNAIRQYGGGTALAQMCKWDGGDGVVGGASGRERAMPHIKTFARFGDSDRSLAWVVLTSSNLSQAAWGKLEKGGQQLYIKSYEVGVITFSSDLSCYLVASPRSADEARQLGSGSAPTVIAPLPYSLPPVPYTSRDRPWATGAHLASAAPDKWRQQPLVSGQFCGASFYGAGATGALLVTRAARSKRRREAAAQPTRAAGSR